MRRRKPMIIGYGRTSTTDQTAGLAGQERDLAAAGATKMFTEQVSSIAKRDRLAECLAFLREGGVLMVTKPDRLARSTAELLAIEVDLSKRGVGLVVLSMGGERLDTRNPTAKLMLTVLAGVRPGSGKSCSNASATVSPRPKKRENIRAVRLRSTPLRSGD